LNSRIEVEVTTKISATCSVVMWICVDLIDGNIAGHVVCLGVSIRSTMLYVYLRVSYASGRTV